MLIICSFRDPLPRLLTQHFATHLRLSDLRGMEALRQAAGSSFLRGIILYTGHEALPFGPDCWAIPMDVLWRAS